MPWYFGGPNRTGREKFLAIPVVLHVTRIAGRIAVLHSCSVNWVAIIRYDKVGMKEVLKALRQEVLLQLALFIWVENTWATLVTSSNAGSGVPQRLDLRPRESNEAEGSSLETVYIWPSLSGKVI